MGEKGHFYLCSSSETAISPCQATQHSNQRFILSRKGSVWRNKTNSLGNDLFKYLIGSIWSLNSVLTQRQHAGHFTTFQYVEIYIQILYDIPSPSCPSYASSPRLFSLMHFLIAVIHVGQRLKGVQFNNILGSLTSSILLTWPYHFFEHYLFVPRLHYGSDFYICVSLHREIQDDLQSASISSAFVLRLSAFCFFRVHISDNEINVFAIEL